MSVATEFPPSVYIPPRARRTMSGDASRHLALVPAGRPAPSPGTPAVLRPAASRPASLRRASLRPASLRPASHRLIESSGAVSGASVASWPLVVTPALRPARFTRRGVVVAVLATLALGFLLLFVAQASAGSAPAGVPAVAAGSTVTVQPGDTLWSIAQRAQPNRDPRGVVDRLLRLNHLDSVSLIPGQTLKVG